MPSRTLLLAAAIGLSIATASADIYVWRDVAGGEHYTNSMDGVPEDRRDSATLFVRERPRAAPEPAPPAEPEPVPAVVAEDEIEDRVVRAFAAGVEAGTEAAADGEAEIVPATIVQTTEVFVEPDEGDTIVVGGFGPGRRGRRPRAPTPEDASDVSSVFGPAGPPPIGAAGPPPVNLE